MNFLNKKNENKTSANVVDNHLILSIPNAQKPVLWRMELKKTGVASFEIKEDKDGQHLLIVKPTKTTSETIAPFEDKQDAIDALMIVSNALQNAPSTATDQNASTVTKVIKKSEKNLAKTTSNDNKSGSTWLIVILGTATVIGLFAYLSSLVPQNTTLNAQTISSIENSSPQTATGVPVSADDFLNGL